MEQVISNPDLIDHIFSFLEGNYLVALAFVCRSWKKLCKGKKNWPKFLDVGYSAFLVSKQHLTLLKWARNNGCSWNCGVYWEAAKAGNIEILDYANEEGCPRSFDGLGNGELTTVFLSISSDQMDSLKWLHNNGWEWNWAKDACMREAVLNKRQRIAEWIENIL